MNSLYCFAEVPYPGDPCFNYDPDFPEMGAIACFDTAGKKICCNPSGGSGGSGSPGTSSSSGDMGFIGAAAVAFVIIGAIAAIAKAKVKGKKSSTGIGTNLQQSRTGRDYQTSSRPQYSQPDSPTRTTSDTNSIPEPIKMDNGQSIEGIGITEGGPSFPKPDNVKLERQGNFTNVSWNSPTQKDFEGRKHVGYEVYREIQRYSGGDWITERESLMDPNRTSYSWENVYAEKFYGVKALYRGQDGTLFSSIAVNPNYPSEV